MRCHDVRTLLGPYLDSELDAKISYEIEQHLETCADCARVFEAERKLDERIFTALRQGQKTPELWEGLESRIAAPKFWHRIMQLRPLTVVSIVTPLAAIIVFLAVLVWPKTQSLDLAAAIEKDHLAYLDGKIAPEFTGRLPDDIAQSLGGRLDAEAFSNLPSAATFSPQGARVCHLAGVPVAWILGHYRDVPVSLIVLKRSELEHFPQIKRRLDSGEPIVCTHAGQFQFAARFVGNHVVCAVAKTSKSVLEDLVKSVGESG